ncbi:MAG: pantoate--beta-alanine ligase [Sphingobacterium sp.]
MEIFRTKIDLQNALNGLRQIGQTTALIPTMGALHQGHLSLIEFAKAHADIIICSIFVNPTQFNDPADLEKYPRPIEQDIALLESTGCHILFLPSVEEMYTPDENQWHIDLNGLDRVWEGERRPGHFQGVTQIVYKLFNLVQPDQACFGQKDFQQIRVIQHMIEQKELPVKLLISPTVRNPEGLALSSRNQRLSEKGKKNALVLHQALRYIQTHFHTKPIAQITQEAQDIVQANSEVKLEYLSICQADTLTPVQHQTPDPNTVYVALVAAWVDQVRLIDNVLLNQESEYIQQLDRKA